MCQFREISFLVYNFCLFFLTLRPTLCPEGSGVATRMKRDPVQLTAVLFTFATALGNTRKLVPRHLPMEHFGAKYPFPLREAHHRQLPTIPSTHFLSPDFIPSTNPPRRRNPMSLSPSQKLHFHHFRNTSCFFTWKEAWPMQNGKTPIRLPPQKSIH